MALPSSQLVKQKYTLGAQIPVSALLGFWLFREGMEDSESGSGSGFLNPWVLHFQKLGLELKCPLCLSLLERPMLLPCNHIFCNSCITVSTQLKLECAVCKAQYFNKDSRPAPYIENLVTIYRGLEATFNANLFHCVFSGTTGICSGRVLEQCQTSNRADKLNKEPFEVVQGVKSCSGLSIFSLSGNKRVHVPLNLNHAVEHEVSKDNRYEKHSTPTEGKGGRAGDNVLRTNLPSLTLPMLPGGFEELNVVEIELNQVARLLPNAPPSFCHSKGSDGDSYDRGNKHCPENSLIKRAINKDSKDEIRQLRHESSASVTEDDHLRGIKRQKKLVGAPELSMKRYDQSPPVASHAEILVTSGSEVEVESIALTAPAQPPANSDLSFLLKSICAFCQSFEISENTGPMLHYANGKTVAGDKAMLSNVIHVHRLCVDWAPQVYFVDETVKNLKAEVARGAKLKCSRCGQKGAALGCYAKSCRKSYHLPCAAAITNCRWDHENFLMLCPSHSSVKFPNEKSNKSKKHDSKDHSLPSQRTPQQSKLWVAPNGAEEWVICGSALSAEEKVLLVKFASICGATVTKSWKRNVTHVIAATDAQGACTRTLKVLMAILNGRWIVKMGWIKACMEAMHAVDEEPYEVSLDNQGCSDGPRTGRLMALSNMPKLFNGLKFYFSGDFLLEYKDDLQNLIVTAGGTVLESTEELVPQSCGDQEASGGRILVVYSLTSPEGCKVGEEVDILWKRLSEAQDVAAHIRSRVIGHTWILESIAACKLQPFVI